MSDTDLQEVPVGDTTDESGLGVSSEPIEPIEQEPEALIEPAGDERAISEAVHARAKEYGLSEADLEGFDDARAERMFSAIDRRIMQPQSQAQGPQPQIQGPPPVSGGRDEYVPLNIEFGDDVDESVTKSVRSVVDHLNGQLQQVHAFRRQAQAELQAMNVLRELSDFDRFVSGLGEDWSSEYGSGVTVEMDSQGNEFKKRLEVFQGAKSLLTDAQRQRRRMSMSDALLRSHRAVHWDRIAEYERNKLDGKIDRRRKGFAERPTKGRAPALSPRDEAIEAWK